MVMVSSVPESFLLLELIWEKLHFCTSGDFCTHLVTWQRLPVQEWFGVCNKTWNYLQNYLEIVIEAQNCWVCTGALEAGWPQTPAESLSSLLGTCSALRSPRVDTPQLSWAISFSFLPGPAGPFSLQVFFCCPPGPKSPETCLFLTSRSVANTPVLTHQLSAASSCTAVLKILWVGVSSASAVVAVLCLAPQEI